MSHDPDAKKTSDVPYSLVQNPAPNPATQGQAFIGDRGTLVNDIMAAFRAVLPSNYVAKTNGPWYSLQFQAMAEQLADIQITATEVFKDSQWDFTRTDFLWQVLGTLVFPGATDSSGIPQIAADVAYRKFLHKMVLLLMQGATKSAMEGGLEALDADLIATITERYLESAPRNANGAFTIADQFTVDIFVEGTGSTFPADPFVTQENAVLVLAALKPAHVLYTYSYLFRDAFGLITDTDGMSLDLDSYYYDDLRGWCLGAKEITGTLGSTLTGRTLFSDSTRSFASIRVGAPLRVSSGANAGVYRVIEVLALPAGANATPYAYTTSSGGSGTLTALSSDTVYDSLQDWGGMPLDTTLTITAGPNAGTYRLGTVLGLTGGPMGSSGAGTRVRLEPSILKVNRRMPSVLSGQSYTVEVDRLGRQSPRTVVAEDVSNQFWT